MVKIVKVLSEFNEIIAKNKYVIVDFFADWCGPCKVIGPIFEKLSVENPDIVCLKVNVDEAPDISEKLAISAMPTFKAFRDGANVNSLTGASEPKLRSLFADIKK